MNRRIFTTTSALIILCAGGQSYNILGIFPLAAGSHFRMFETIMKELARQGHTVTVISCFTQKNVVKNYRDIHLENDQIVVLDLPGERWSLYNEFFIILDYAGQYLCEKELRSKAFREFLKTDEKFDLIILEQFVNECFMGLAHKFKVPIIGITTRTIMHWDNNKFGNPSNPAYIANNMLTIGQRKSFLERLETMIVNEIHQFFHDYYVNVKNQKVAEEVFGIDLPLLSAISQNISLLFTNSHSSITPSVPLVPGIIEIAGVHIDSVKKLPEHIEKWINESSHGVVYFTMGSIIKAHTFPEEKREMFIKAFRRIPQRILMKWENDTIPGKPENVMIESWLPQFDILCHPNVKAFITHGGMFGLIEAAHCGVPMIIIPIISDQISNAIAIEDSGGGIVLQYEDLSEKLIYDALVRVLDPRFKKKATELSARFKDRPLPPLDTAIYWIEYVVKHGGAYHLRTAAVGMPLYKYLLLDVIAFLLFISLSSIFAVYYIIIFVAKCVRGLKN